MFSGFSHVVAWNETVFLFIYHIVAGYTTFSSSFSYGQSGCFHFLAVVYNAAFEHRAQVFM